MELKEDILSKPVIMNSISKCGINPPANEKKPLFSQLSFQNISICADSCSCFSHKWSWCLPSSRDCSAGTYFMAQSCVVAPHTHFIHKGAAHSPQNMPWSWIFSWTSKFWVSCEMSQWRRVFLQENWETLGFFLQTIIFCLQTKLQKRLAVTVWLQDCVFLPWPLPPARAVEGAVFCAAF